MNQEEQDAHGIPSLPGSLYEALEAFKESEIARVALGDHIFNEFVKAKTAEWDDFRTYVSPWETERYMGRV